MRMQGTEAHDACVLEVQFVHVYAHMCMCMHMQIQRHTRRVGTLQSVQSELDLGVGTPRRSIVSYPANPNPNPDPNPRPSST